MAEIDETHSWRRHVIDSNVNRDHGHSIGAADLTGDGGQNVLIAFGERGRRRSTDGVYWYESVNKDVRGEWLRYRLSEPSIPIRWCMALACADMDNDGDIDVVALSFNSGNVYLMVNPLHEGLNIKEPWPTLTILESPGVFRDGENLELVDIDGDNFLDVVFPRGKGKEIHVLYNPSGKLSEQWQDFVIGIHGGTDAHDVYTADIDNDNDPDIVSASGDSTWKGSVFWFEHPDDFSRDRSWKRRRISKRSANYGGLQIDDVNNDGWPDVLVTEAHATPGKVLWYENPKNVAKDYWDSHLIGFQTFPHAGLSFDVDGDGENEYWTPDSSHDTSGKFGYRSGGIVYFKSSDLSDIWAMHRIADPPEVGRQCVALDMDGDGDLDVLSTADHCTETHSISIVWWENRIRDEYKNRR